jgi:hypothetical protein
MLGAGRAGSTAYGSNVNMVQFGDRLQGLTPQATHFFIAGNGRAGWQNYQTRTNAPKRNYVYCMNQLGGVGRGKSQFKIDGVNNPDGSQTCNPYPYDPKGALNKNKIIDTNNNYDSKFQIQVDSNPTDTSNSQLANTSNPLQIQLDPHNHNEVSHHHNSVSVTHLGVEYNYKEEENLYYYFAKPTDNEDDDEAENVANESETNVEARYVSMLPLSDSTWENKTSNIATYEGLRYEQTNDIPLRLFRETLHIIISNISGDVIGTIRASSIYKDEGTSSTTTVSEVGFPVQSADGIFSGVKIIKIFYDNDTYTDINVRTLKLYR